MKKITLLLLTLFFSIASYSQLGGTGVEGFESTTGPDASPSTNWTLGTGNWYVFNNVSSATTRWGITSAATTPPQVNSGTNAAYCIRSTSFPDGQIENYLATPLVNIPSNGQLHFWTRNFLIGTQGTVFQIKVAPSTANPTDPNSYSLVQQWTDADLVTTFNIYEEKVVNLAAFQGLQVYVAFVMQQDPILSPFGDRWFVDDVSIVEQCFDPTNLTANNITLTSAQLSWGNPSGATSWEIEIVPAASSPTGTGIVYNNATPTYTATATQPAGVAFTATTSYKYYVRAICSGGTTSAWIGPYSFATTSPGLSCNAPIQVTSLPYSTTDSTANYSDNPTIEGSPGTSCGITGNYLNGNDVVYSYTAPANGTISVTMTPTGNNSGIFAYSSCANIGTTCLNGAAGTTATVRTFNLPVTAGQTYYFVISSLNTTQTVGYTLVIQTVNCAPPTNLAVSGITQTGANLNWAAGGSTSWEVVVQAAGGGIPSGAGITTTNNTAYPTPNPLTPNTNYEFYVRADCNDGSGNFSAWTGPFVFRTLCTAFNVPFQEGFNSTSTTEACWTVLNVNADTDAWDMNYATNPFEGNQSAMLYTDFNAGNNNDWLISPQIILTGNQRLKYHYRVQSATEPNDFRVMLSTNGTSPVDFTTTLVPLASYNNITYMQAIVNLSAYTGPVNIAWHVPPGGLDGWRLYIDNVIIEDLPTCPEPSLLTSSAVLSTSATLTWTNGNAETEWQILALPCGSPAPTAAATGFVTTTTGSPYNLIGLSPTTCYDVYVRAVCPGPDESPWTGPTTFTTQVAPPVCGGQYIDAGGATANYPNNSNSTVTICPPAGQVVTVTFVSFNTETNWDALYVFDGNSTGAPQIASTNGAGNVPGGLAGGYWGTTIPGPFTSTSADGCLTFNFRSDGSVNNPGWVANVTCAPPPTCRRPTAIVSSAVTHNTVNLTWTQPVNPDNSVASQWEVLALPCGSPAPTATATGFVTANTNNSFTLTGLNPDTCYDIYIRAVCSTTDSSEWGGPVTITTQIAPPVCGGTFTDAAGANANYANNSNSTVIICPTNPNEVVTVTFTSFFTEANWDALYVFDGNSTSAPQIASTNGAGNVPGGLAGGYWGNLNTNLPGPFTSSSNDGCLTFNFRSDGSVNNPGWVANVTCAPAPNCQKPINLTSAEITSSSALLGWTEPNPAVVQWEVIIVPFGSPVPLPTDTGTLVSVNPALFTGLDPGTQYTFYVRGICPTSGTSAWSTGANFTTLVINDNCDGAIFAPVNQSQLCQQVTPGTVAGATASTPAPQAPCVGTADDDVWFQFAATNPYLTVALQNITGSTTNLNFAVYSGQCGSLTQIFCSAANTVSGVVNGLSIGQTYYIRVYSNAATPQTTTFDLCITTPASCLIASSACQNLSYQNTTGIANQGAIGCMATSPNPTFYTINVTQTGTINLLLTQSTTQGGAPNLDVDYAAWGPFPDQAAACAYIGNSQPYGAPSVNGSCNCASITTCSSYSAAATENFNFSAVAGQVFVILITNFSNQPGYISLTQTNFGSAGAGVYECCPDAYFTYNPASYCQYPGAPNPIPTISVGSVAGTFSLAPGSASGLVFADTSTGEVDLANSLPGNYVINNIVAATSSCTQKTRGYNISIVAPVSATIDYNNATYCNNITTPQAVNQTGATGGSYSVSPNGGLYINVNTGSITPSLSAPGVYTISYQLPGSGVCTGANPSAQVEILPVPNIQSPGNQTVCGSYTLPVLNVGDYYTGPGATGTMLTAGDVLTTSQTIYMYADLSGCTDEKSFELIVNPELAVDELSDVGTCSTYTLPTLTVGNYYTGAGGTGTMLNAGDVISTNQTIYIYASNATCSDEHMFTVTIGNLVVTAPASAAYCDNFNLPALTTAGNYYTGAGGTGTMLNEGDAITSTQTIYVYAEVDGCIGEDSFVVTINSVVTPTVTLTQPTCAVQSGTIEVTDPVGANYEYSIDGINFQALTTFAGLAPGNYTVTVTDLTTTCQNTLDVVINAIPLTSSDPQFTYPTPVCQNATSNPMPSAVNPATFTSGGQYSEDTSVSTGLVINASTGEVDLVNSTTGQHTIKYEVLEDLTICQAAGSFTFVITINPVITPVVGFSYTTPVCQNGTNPNPIPVGGFTTGGIYSYTTTGSGTLDLNTSSGVINLANSTAGSYTVIYTVGANTANCQVSNSYSAPIVIDPIVTPVVGFDYTTPVVCHDDANQSPNPGTGFTTGGVYSSTSGLIINGSTGEIDVVNSTPGSYTVSYYVAPNAANCQVENTGTASFTIMSPFSVAASGDCVGVNYVVTATPIDASFDPTAVTYSWEDSTGLYLGNTQSIVVTNTGDYTVTVTSNGCDNSTTVTVDSISCVIQKGISVNGDGLNDCFDLTGFDVKSLQIFNRYGMKVYSKGNYTQQWCGQADNGDELPDGTYYYVINRNNGETKTGWIYLNRAQ
ncbi:choice-of-anchor J domain-containing protein [Flavobacterium capsici]|uniref:Choice-of-anchor J domain-containing protein n=1 Tax=Flavobacterium capsici TaxID=3075618 RepID=A0AA96EYR4_9FLAO|nr:MULTISPECIES: choice-of-anchor J domain-containing protein [unclassified Flavobacterium]WNM19502.1 choice-of-anchor J domain-containing protein [Flavobacterium sp. PMR2A8]WNM20891.1 choice-of-anchor J domain-containing protein [Flavobacterium sp. PMTSA4]